MEIFWIIGIVVGLVVVVVILAAAVRGMRPKLPEPQRFTPSPVMPRSAPASAAPTTVSGLTPQVTAEIDRLVASGQKINAIKVFRRHTQVSLKSAKDRIDHWSVSTTAPHAAAISNATAVHSSITPQRTSLPAPVVAQIDKFVASGSPIAAIQLLRQHTNLGLKEAKNVIDAWVPGRSR